MIDYCDDCKKQKEVRQYLEPAKFGHNVRILCKDCKNKPGRKQVVKHA